MKPKPPKIICPVCRVPMKPQADWFVCPKCKGLSDGDLNEGGDYSADPSRRMEREESRPKVPRSIHGRPLR